MKNKDWNGLPVVIFGVGGLAKKIKATIEEINKNSYIDIFDLKGFVSDKEEEVGNLIQDLEVVTTNDKIAEYAKDYPELGVILAFGNPEIKCKIYSEIKEIKSLVYPNIIHPKATLYKSNLKLGIGNQIMAGVNICIDVKIGAFNLINLNSTIGHDAIIKDFTVINPLASISGNTEIEDEVLIGTGSNILQNLKVNEKSIVGAGALVTKTVEKFSKVVGVPARVVKENGRKK